MPFMVLENLFKFLHFTLLLKPSSLLCESEVVSLLVCDIFQLKTKTYDEH